MGNATGIFNLMRNIGGSIGISMATTLVARGAQAHQAMMVGHLTPYDPQFQQYLHMLAAGLSRYGGPVAHHRAYGWSGRHPDAAGRPCAYVDTFRILAVLCVLCVPLVLVFQTGSSARRPGGGA